MSKEPPGAADSRTGLFTFLAGRPSRARHCCAAVLLALLLIGCTALVYITGGTSYAYPYLMLIPIIWGAALYRTAGGLTVALAAGLLVGPYMPLEVREQIAQPMANWVLRLALYLVVGGFTGALFGRLARIAKRREAAMRVADCGLLNSVALSADLSHALTRSAKSNRTVALVLVQVSDYSEILSGVGADSGDDLIGAIGRNLREAIADVSDVYRFGAAELVVLLSYRDPRELDTAIDRILAVGEEPVLVHNVPVRAQLVAGISHARDCDSPQELIRRIRVAAFEAGEQHRAFCHYAAEYERDTAETMRLVAQVRRALAAGEFEVHYQPKIRLADNSVYGCESLVRWRGERGWISPGRFMPKVERTTLINPVTRFVATQATEFLDTGIPAPVSVNFAVGSLQDDKLLEWLLRLVEEKTIAANALEVEITEGALIRDPRAARETIERLRDAGICVLLDDFGTGYSSFDYLRHLPITGLKIDRAFVQDLESDRRAYKLMACMIDVAHALDLTVTAEGVERPEQAVLLKELGCDLAQGFLYAQAMPQDRYLQWLREGVHRPALPAEIARSR